MQEIYLPVVSFESLYEVSNLGNVRSLRRLTRCVSKAGLEFKKPQGGCILKKINHSAGYLSLVLSNGPIRKGALIHRLVAESHIPNPNNFEWVNHIDGNKHNNNLTNLEWCSPKANSEHAFKNGLMRVLYGSERKSSKLNEDKVHVIKKMILLGFTNKELSLIFKVSTAPISYIRNNQAWTHVPW